jgi:hypothetical protein
LIKQIIFIQFNFKRFNMLNIFFIINGDLIINIKLYSSNGVNQYKYFDLSLNYGALLDSRYLFLLLI